LSTSVNLVLALSACSEGGRNCPHLQASHTLLVPRMLFYLSLLGLFAIVFMGLIHYRSRIIPLLPTSVQSRLPTLPFWHPGDAGYSRVPTSFASQASLGLSSAAFDLEQNIHGGDSRAGLDEVGTQEVLEIMRAEHVNFDEARLRRHNRLLAHNGIDPTGMPLDSKAVTRL